MDICNREAYEKQITYTGPFNALRVGYKNYGWYAYYVKARQRISTFISIASQLRYNTDCKASPNPLGNNNTIQKDRLERIYTNYNNLLLTQLNIQLNSCSDITVEYPIINTDPSKFLDMLGVLVAQKSNPMVDRILFSFIFPRRTLVHSKLFLFA